MRTLLWLGLAVMLGACAERPATSAAPARSPAAIGALAAKAYLDTPDLMRYDVGAVHAVHYADAASAYGALRFAEATHDAALIERVHRREAIAATIPDTANHVDVSVYGVWPLELARLGGDPAARARGLALADGQWRDLGPDGLTTQARYWIDDLWMIGALQIEAWRVTHDRKYLDRAARTARLYLARLQEPNGLFHHGADGPFFWARGNGWVAAALAEILSELPRDHPDYPPIVAGYRRMMAALLRYQTPSGLWRQLIDRSDAWEESSGSAMFGFAIASGVKHGILRDPAYARAYRRAWAGVASRVDAEGRLSGVCVGTGQSKDAAYYLARPTVTGDFHGQAALLWFAAAMAR